MSVANLPIIIYQGSIFTLNLTYKDSDGNNINLSSFNEAYMVGRLHKGASTVLFSWSKSGGEITLGNGTIDIAVGSSVTAAFNFEWGVYDIEIEETDETDRTRVLEGQLTLSKEVAVQTPS